MKSVSLSTLGISWAVPMLAGCGAASGLAWFSIRLLGDLRQHLAPFYGWFALAFGCYLATLWLVRRLSSQALPPRHVGWLLAIVAIGAVVFRAILLPTTPTLSNDIYRYRWDGRVQQAGFDPYAYPPDAPELAALRDAQWQRINFPRLRTIYPPLTQQAFHLGARLGHSLTIQKGVFIAAELALLACLVALLRARRLSPLWIAAYAWHPLAILEIAGSGHNDAIGIACLWLGVLGWQLKQRWAAAVAWAMAFLAKYAAVILVPWWWCRRIGRRWLLLFAALAAAPLVCCPTILSALWESLSAMTVRFESNSSVYVLLASLMGQPGAARLVVVLLWVAFLAWWARREADPVRYLLGAFATAAVLSPVLHPWYLLWMLPCFCFVRPAALVTWTAVVVLSYAVWPGYLAGGAWAMPVWAHAGEYALVVMAGLWSIRRWWWRSLFRLAMKPALSVRS